MSEGKLYELLYLVLLLGALLCLRYPGLRRRLAFWRWFKGRGKNGRKG